MGYFDAPAGMNDADLEMAHLEELGNRSAALKKRGICTHGYFQVMEDKTAECLDCGKTFPSSEHLHEEATERLYDE